MRAAAVDLDAVLGDTRPLWSAWLEDFTRRARVELELPADRATAIPELDRAAGNWRALLQRFAEDHVALHLRPHPEVNAALRSLSANGIRLGAFTDAPPELASIALAHLGVTRRLQAVETGPAALERLLERLGADTVVIRNRDELFRAEA
jgi:phosphoglycolate phosphatase-like HAD superfamily hydrolase